MLLGVVMALTRFVLTSVLCWHVPAADSVTGTVNIPASFMVLLVVSLVYGFAATLPILWEPCAGTLFAHVPFSPNAPVPFLFHCTPP